MSIGANAAAAIIPDLRGRRGFDGVWDYIDEDTAKDRGRVEFTYVKTACEVFDL